MTTLSGDPLAFVRATPGLEAYLEQVEARLRAAVDARGVVSEAGAEALLAGGKRLRPVLAFLAAGSAGAEAAGADAADAVVAAGVAVELVHLATLVHDDLLDRAEVRRGVPAAWRLYGDHAALCAGDFLFARAFAELAATGDASAVAVLADASLALARGEAMQRQQMHDPSTPVQAYLERCSLKTAALFEAACVLGAGRREHRLTEYGRALGLAFQIADDVLDCAGDTIETGKVPGTDLADGVPTLPLLLAAERDEAVRAALAGGPSEGALVRVAATGALDRSRETALDYARKARSCLDGEVRRAEFEALTYAVVERRS